MKFETARIYFLGDVFSVVAVVVALVTEQRLIIESRLRVVPIFPQGIVEQAKRERA